jgi:hypothetical protein
MILSENDLYIHNANSFPITVPSDNFIDEIILMDSSGDFVFTIIKQRFDN